MTRGRLAPIALLAMLACTPAGAQTGGRDAAALPPATGASAREAIVQAHREIASAAENLTRADGEEGGTSLTAAYRDAQDARGAMQQAMSAAKADEGLPDEVSDRLNRAIDKTSDAVRLLEEAASPADADAALEHLEEAAAELDGVSGHLGR